MYFDQQGHIVVTPKQLHQLAVENRKRLIHAALLPGTPAAIPTHDQHFDLLQHFADSLGIHPNNLFFKGSTKIGFSIAPKSKKVWMAFGPESDLDLAIVDAEFFSRIDNEVGMWERSLENRQKLFRVNSLLKAHKDRGYHKGTFDCYRFFDLPNIDCMNKLNECINTAPVVQCCGIQRPMNAFVFRHWWGVYNRYDHDLHCLCRALKDKNSQMPAAEDEPRPHEEVLDIDIDEIQLEMTFADRDERIGALEEKGAIWDAEGQFFALDGKCYDADGELL
ncbi:MAG: hypothetical protein LW850_28395 [Planctomycetaceae bacterium]|jgi:hypothetical protein|nr:hypothetical protein [Planctomycetaceae bacterium]